MQDLHLKQNSPNAPKMIFILEMQGKKYSDLKWFRDFEESNVLDAAEIPYNLIFPWMKTNSRLAQIERERFQHDLERRRNTVSRLIERQLFPRILGRDYEYGSFPRLIFHD